MSTQLEFIHSWVTMVHWWPLDQSNPKDVLEIACITRTVVSKITWTFLFYFLIVKFWYFSSYGYQTPLFHLFWQNNLNTIFDYLWQEPIQLYFDIPWKFVFLPPTSQTPLYSHYIARLYETIYQIQRAGSLKLLRKCEIQVSRKFFYFFLI